MDVQPVNVTDVEVSEVRRRVSLVLDELAPGYVYQLELSGLQATDGQR